jgi:hypothetical protein
MIEVDCEEMESGGGMKHASMCDNEGSNTQKWEGMV